LCCFLFQPPQFTLVAVCALALSAALAWHVLHKPTIYLVDYIAQRPDDRYVTTAVASRKIYFFSKNLLLFKLHRAAPR
jgi:hypothetical protein